MGIDIYLRWPNQTKAEKEGQYTGFSITAGDVGYLREAYHGGPYATKHLLREAFNDEGEAKIPASVLRERLPETIMLAIYREHVVYGEGDPTVADVTNGVSPVVVKLLKEASAVAKAKQEAPTLTPEQVKAAEALIATRTLPDYALAFVDFVELATQKEAELGHPCTIIASY